MTNENDQSRMDSPHDSEDARTAATALPNATAGKQRTELRVELRTWITKELEFYVKNFISDGDYAQLRKNLIDIATAHAQNMAAIDKAEGRS